MRKCSNCFKVKPLNEFYIKRTKYKDRIITGHQSRCKACNAEVVCAYNSRKRWLNSRAHAEVNTQVLPVKTDK